jgi:hypothetical protein
MEEEAESSGPRARRESQAALIERLVELQSKLANLLRPIDDDAQQMDASLQDAHEIVEEIRGFVKQTVFGPEGPLDASDYRDNYQSFEKARIEENDMREVYADDLERYATRRRKEDLGVADLDADRLALVRRRRVYLSTLRAFQDQVLALLDYLRGRPPSG